MPALTFLSKTYILVTDGCVMGRLFLFRILVENFTCYKDEKFHSFKKAIDFPLVNLGTLNCAVRISAPKYCFVFSRDIVFNQAFQESSWKQ